MMAATTTCTFTTAARHVCGANCACARCVPSSSRPRRTNERSIKIAPQP
jgi:hypothetical protein